MSSPVQTVAEPAAPALGDHRVKGIALMVLGIFVMSVLDAAGKWAVADYHVIQINAIRGIFAVAVLLPMTLRGGGLTVLRTTRPMVHIARSVLIIFLAYSWFYTLKFLPLADVVAISMVAPLFVAALSVPFLGEHVGPVRWTAIGIGFVGMLLIIQPGSTVFQPISLLPVLAALGYSIFMMSNRALRKTESLAALAIYPQAAVLVVSALLAPLVWTPPTGGALAVMALMGICAGLGHLLLTAAFRYAPSSMLAPFDYTALIWATSFGYLLFGDLPQSLVVLGMALITVGGLIVIYREARA